MFGISGDRIIYASVVWNKIYSKDLIEAIRFKDLYAIEDREFNLRAYLGVENVPYDPRKYYYYVQREESIVHNSATVHRRLYSTLEGLIEMYHELPASENMIRELLLGDIYRKMLSRHSILRKTSYFKCMKSLCDGFVKETGRNYLKCRSIPMKEKIAFAFFSKFPKMTDYYLATLNKG